MNKVFILVISDVGTRNCEPSQYDDTP